MEITEEQIKILRVNQSELTGAIRSLLFVVAEANREKIKRGAGLEDMMADAQRAAGRVKQRLDEFPQL